MVACPSTQAVRTCWSLELLVTTQPALKAAMVTATPPITIPQEKGLIISRFVMANSCK
jgi:hypothetical protein